MDALVQHGAAAGQLGIGAPGVVRVEALARAARHLRVEHLAEPARGDRVPGRAGGRFVPKVKSGAQ